MSWLDRLFGSQRRGSAGQADVLQISAGSNTFGTGTVVRPPEAGYPGWIVQPGQVLLGNYRIERMVGSPGGMGQVYAAEDTALGLKVAIKVPALNILLDPSGANKFLEEARTAARLGPHPHIVQIRVCLTDPNLRIPVGSMGAEVPIPFIVMEYLGGGDLAKLLKDGPLDLHTVAVLFEQVCSALQCAHSYVYQEEGRTVRGVIHRDLKPENICFDENGRLVIVDFGLARLLGRLSSTVGMAGTPSYMAPEQWNPAHGVDQRTDIYALGIILFQMLTGRLPFTGTMEEIMAGHLTKAPPDPRQLRSDVPSAVAEAILKALAKEKEARFQSVEQFAEVVAVGFKGSGVGAEKVVRVQSAQPPNSLEVNGKESLQFCSHCEQRVQPDLVAGKLYCSNCGLPWAPIAQGAGPSQWIATPTPPETEHRSCVHCGNSAPPSIVAGVQYCSECGMQLQDGVKPRVEDRPQEASNTACKYCGSNNPPGILPSGTYCSDCGRQMDG